MNFSKQKMLTPKFLLTLKLKWRQSFSCEPHIQNFLENYLHYEHFLSSSANRKSMSNKSSQKVSHQKYIIFETFSYWPCDNLSFMGLFTQWNRNSIVTIDSIEKAFGSWMQIPQVMRNNFWEISIEEETLLTSSDWIFIYVRISNLWRKLLTS